MDADREQETRQRKADQTIGSTVGEHPRVLIIDDDPEAIIMVEQGFRIAGFHTTCAISLEDASQKIADRPVDLIVLDWMLDRGTGNDAITNCIKEIATRYCPVKRVPVLIHSGISENNIKLRESPIFVQVGYWQKPMRPSAILEGAKFLAKLPHMKKIAGTGEGT